MKICPRPSPLPLLFGVVAAVVALSSASCRSVSGVVASRWQLVWEDCFEGDAIDTTVWSVIDRGPADWRNYMSAAAECFDVSGGDLVLRGIRNDVEPQDTAPYLTGGVFTRGKRAFGNGRMEVRARMEGAQGAWPAIWMLPRDSRHWPYGGEIDIMERLNHRPYVYQTIHSVYADIEGNTAFPPNHTRAAIDPYDYNVYAVEVSDDSLSFYVNERLTFVYPRLSDAGAEQFPFCQPYYLIIGMQLGGKWVGAVDATQLPVAMYVDYVRFYEPAER